MTWERKKKSMTVRVEESDIKRFTDAIEKYNASREWFKHTSKSKIVRDAMLDFIRTCEKE